MKLVVTVVLDSIDTRMVETQHVTTAAVTNQDIDIFRMNHVEEPKFLLTFSYIQVVRVGYTHGKQK